MEAVVEEQRERWMHTAVTTYWIYTTIPVSKKGERKMPMREWLKQFGIDSKGLEDTESVDSIRKRVEGMERQIFKSGRKQKSNAE